MTCAPTVLQMYWKVFETMLGRIKPQIDDLQEKRTEVSPFKRNGHGFLDGGATFYFFLDFRSKILDSTDFCNGF